MYVCKACSGQHYIRQCSEFLQMPVQARIDLIKRNNMCINCLALNHVIANCSSRYSCSQCNKRHHSLLNLTQSSPSNFRDLNAASNPFVAQDNQASTSQAHLLNISHSSSAPIPDHYISSSHIQSASSPYLSKEIQQNFFVHAHRRVLLATALVDIRGRDGIHRVRALIDPGSESSIITEATQQRLNLPTKASDISILGVNGTQTAKSNKKCLISIINSEVPSESIVTSALILKKLTNNLPSMSFASIDPYELEGLCLADPTFNNSSQVNLLIGADLYPSIIRNGVKHIANSLLAQKTVFGWILSGPIPHTVQAYTTRIVDNESLDKSVKRFWELEEVSGLKHFASEQDKYCEDLYTKSTFRLPNGRYVVSLPFKPEFEPSYLGNSRNVALQQFFRTERNLQKKTRTSK